MSPGIDLDFGQTTLSNCQLYIVNCQLSIAVRPRFFGFFTVQFSKTLCAAPIFARLIIISYRPRYVNENLYKFLPKFLPVNSQSKFHSGQGGGI